VNIGEVLKAFWRLILRLIEAIIAIRLGRRITPLSEEPFQKASEWEKHWGFFFVGTFPIFAQCGVSAGELTPVSMQRGFPLWLTVTAVASLYFIFLWIVSPKIPLWVSLLIGAMSYPLVIWLNWPRF
jgi:hypothetical protein